jgi:hypothetical protein
MKRKVKKFRAGGDYESSDDARNLIAAADREKAEYEGRGRDVYDETGAKSRFKRNLETGELYDPTGEVLMTKTVTRRVEPAARAAAPAVKGDEGATASGMAREARGVAAKAEAKPETRTFAEKQSAAADKMQGAYRSSVADMASYLKRLLTPTASNPRIRRELAEGTRIRSEMKKGGVVKSAASKRADGCAQRGKTRGKMV